MTSRNLLRYTMMTLPLTFFLLLFGLVVWPTEATWTIERIPSGSIITVNTTDDELNSDGDCSLREAVRSANLNSAVDGCLAGSGADTINIPAGTYELSIAGNGEDAALTGDLDLAEDVTVEGSTAAATRLDASFDDRIFHVQSSVQATFSDIAIIGGQELSFGGGGLMTNANSRVQINDSLIISNTARSGGGIINAGIMTITHSTIATNTATIDTGGGIVTGSGASITLVNSTVRNNQGVAGGGLSTFNGTITVIASTISDNDDTSPLASGGGIRAVGGSNISVINSTVSGNHSPFGGGGIYAFSGSVINLYNATIANNSTDGSGGGLNTNSATTNMHNSILADNSGPTDPDCAAVINSLGYNLIETDTAACVINGNQTGVLTLVDPALGPLQDNGGSTYTQALVGASPAINGGNPAGCTDPASQPLTTDQRGFSRPVGAVCDIGAYEASTSIYLPLVIRE
ncbi:MAG: CSLREA domain-containing protein [Chloroflexi bacterium]|nr:CSLREA domain-containing protein [Chloroflexota bacterium]MCI0575970.1 CSLREA domain-containing protein [Chloroflexota bacterium]